ncbi:MFS family permease [Neobacillus niacini]|uniref:MFS transporter n=1 Tax=Neobacillus niacini TaxID=86668 RepID=UPI00285BAAAF|nr:MFS transporter [Neobacillus niacini]MDR7079094.1 MFS family permease [Neobacillus niacini]
MNKSKLWTKDFINISLSNFFLFLTFYILLVTLPIFALQEFDSNASQAGLMTTVFLLSAIVSRPLAGQWLERASNRKVLLTALIIFAAASLLYFFPKTVTGFLVIRLLHGVGFGMATTAVGAIVADLIPSSRRGEGMGYFVMSTKHGNGIRTICGIDCHPTMGSKDDVHYDCHCSLWSAYYRSYS